MRRRIGVINNLLILCSAIANLLGCIADKQTHQARLLGIPTTVEASYAQNTASFQSSQKQLSTPANGNFETSQNLLSFKAAEDHHRLKGYP